jgi:hypothetical protein
MSSPHKLSIDRTLPVSFTSVPAGSFPLPCDRCRTSAFDFGLVSTSMQSPSKSLAFIESMITIIWKREWICASQCRFTNVSRQHLGISTPYLCQASPAHPAWHNWLARETFTIYRDLKVESSSLSVGAVFFFAFSLSRFGFLEVLCCFVRFCLAIAVKCTISL